MNYVGLTEQAASDVASWIRDDADGRRWLASYGDHPSWWRLVVKDADRYGWIFVEDDCPQGFVDLELVGEVAYVAIFVRPASRNCGLGRRVLREVRGLAAELGATRMEGGVDPVNRASRRMCRAAGFVESGVDDDGFIVMGRSLANGDPDAPHNALQVSYTGEPRPIGTNGGSDEHLIPDQQVSQTASD